MDTRVEKITRAVEYIKSIIGGKETPLVGIVLGSGLGKLGELIEERIVIPYKDIPEFAVSTAVGHKGNFIYGRLGGKPVVAMQGRFHFYEGYPMDVVTRPIRVMARLGIQYLFVSNAAGGADPDYNVGDLMIIKDHLNFRPNPLIGPNFEDFGPRFPDMTAPYDLELISKIEKIAAEEGIAVHKGVYSASTGPTYETPAELRYYRQVGADAVGMSTVPEVIVARQCGLRVFGMSVITNKGNFDNVSKVLNDSDDVVVQADKAADRMTVLFRKLIATL
ncbi:MAG: purine-nucleoside phosphorylase [Bacteroidales bacterium]|nr:purine-nucleoside phosphorylase [Bacteroidales bacterium]